MSLLLFLELEMGLWGCCLVPADQKQLGSQNKQNLRCSMNQQTAIVTIFATRNNFEGKIG
jgi:hypothetical protein